MLIKTTYYASDTAYCARVMLEENSVLIGTITQTVLLAKRRQSDIVLENSLLCRGEVDSYFAMIARAFEDGDF